MGEQSVGMVRDIFAGDAMTRQFTAAQVTAHNARIRKGIAAVVTGLKKPVNPRTVKESLTVAKPRKRLVMEYGPVDRQVSPQAQKAHHGVSGKESGYSKRAELSLPWPPSVNMYWRRNKGLGMHISAEGKAYRARVQALCRVVCGVPGHIAVQVIAYPPDRRFRDLDNICKALLDGLVYGGIISDDGLIDDLHITRSERVPGGRVDVVVTPI